MQRSKYLCLLLLAGCASASVTPESQPQPQSRQDVIRRAPGIASVTIPDSVQRVKAQPARFRIVSAACQTNDPMPNASPGSTLVPPGQPRITPGAPNNVPGTMPNAPMLQSIPYIPNACPVTAGPLANQSLPAVLQREEKRIPTPEEP
jgi:hypothetical protein